MQQHTPYAGLGATNDSSLVFEDTLGETALITTHTPVPKQSQWLPLYVYLNGGLYARIGLDDIPDLADAVVALRTKVSIQYKGREVATQSRKRDLVLRDITEGIAKVDEEITSYRNRIMRRAG